MKRYLFWLLFVAPQLSRATAFNSIFYSCNRVWSAAFGKASTPTAALKQSPEEIFAQIKHELKLSDAQTPNGRLFEPKKEEPVAADKIEKIYPGAHDLRALGGGGVGKVYRAQLHNESTVIKVYSNPDNAGIEVRSIRLLKRKIKETGFQFPKMEMGEPDGTALIQDITGRDLSDVLFDKKIPSAVKQKLADQYRKNSARLDQAVKDNFSLAVPAQVVNYLTIPGIEPPLAIHVYKLISESGFTFDFTTKPDNIIVDAKTLEMWINDPF